MHEEPDKIVLQVEMKVIGFVLPKESCFASPGTCFTSVSPRLNKFFWPGSRLHPPSSSQGSFGELNRSNPHPDWTWPMRLLLTSVQWTEESLLKLKSLTPPTAGGMTDDNKIRLQLALDIEEFTGR